MSTPVVVTPQPDPSVQRANEIADGLRSLATMIEDNPGLVDHVMLGSMYLFHVTKAEDQADLARAAMRHGGKVRKDVTDTQHNLLLKFGPVEAYVLASRDAVCERVVVGSETVTKTVKDPDAVAALPDVEVTETVEQVEWVCRPVMAAGAVDSEQVTA